MFSFATNNEQFSNGGVPTDTPQSEMDPLLQGIQEEKMKTHLGVAEDDSSSSPNWKEEQDASKRGGKALWDKLKDYSEQGSLLVPLDSSSRDQKSRLREETLNQIRRLSEFSTTHCLIAIFVYLMLSIMAFSFVLDEWTIVDSCYFAVVTFTTIGYGDITPDTNVAKVFTCFYGLSGVACLGIALGILGDQLVEVDRQAMKKMADSSRSRALSILEDESTSAVKNRDNKVDTEDSPQTWMDLFWQAVYVIQLVVLFFSLAWAVGYVEGWSILSSIWFGVVSGTTIGYGDLSPQSQRGRLFATLLIPVTVGVMGHLLGRFAEFVMSKRRQGYKKVLQDRELTQEDLHIMDVDEDGKVTRAEFLEFMLLAMSQVDRQLLDDLKDQFDKLDANGTGELSRDDLIFLAKKKLKNTGRKVELSAYKKQLLKQAQAANGGQAKGRQASISAALVDVFSKDLLANQK